MRALPVLLLLAACGTPAGPPAGSPIGRGCGELELRNSASVTVEQAYASAGGAADWGPDLLVAGASAPMTLAPGGVQRLRVPAGSSAVRIVFANGRAAEITNLDTCATPVLLIQQNSLLPRR